MLEQAPVHPERGFPAALQKVVHALLNKVGEPAAPRVGKVCRVDVGGEWLEIPARLYFDRRRLVDLLGSDDLSDGERCIAWCLGARHHDGYFRESCVRKLLKRDEPWLVPYVVLPLGEYVLEIVEAIEAGLAEINHPAYRHFAARNPACIALLRQRAASYWDCYYRQLFPTLPEYPPVRVLNALSGRVQ